jgi:hypothetical protein
MLVPGQISALYAPCGRQLKPQVPISTESSIITLVCFSLGLEKQIWGLRFTFHSL